MSSLNVWRFRIPFRSPLTLKGRTYLEREGLLLDRDGQWAEASPLPGFSPETIDDVIAEIGNLKDQDLTSPGASVASPALRFALGWISQEFSAPISVPFNCLLVGDQDRILSRAKEVASAGCTAAKLKVGRAKLEADVALVREVRALIPPGVELRLDANQAWSFEEALKFSQETKDLDIGYIEEPLSDASRLEELYSHTGLKYALDESLIEGFSTGELDSLIDSCPNAAAIICKPTIVGGRSSVQRLAQSGKPIVFSAAFESGIGLARIVQLAHEFSPDIPAGLDTLGWLTTDLLKSSPTKQKGRFEFSQPPMADTTDLERIEL